MAITVHIKSSGDHIIIYEGDTVLDATDKIEGDTPALVRLLGILQGLPVAGTSEAVAVVEDTPATEAPKTGRKKRNSPDPATASAPAPMPVTPPMLPPASGQVSGGTTTLPAVAAAPVPPVTVATPPAPPAPPALEVPAFIAPPAPPAPPAPQTVTIGTAPPAPVAFDGPAALDRNATKVATPAVPKPPVSPAPKFNLGPRIVTEYERLFASATDNGVAMKAWMQDAMSKIPDFAIPDSTFEEMLELLKFTKDEKVEHIAAALEIAPK